MKKNEMELTEAKKMELTEAKLICSKMTFINKPLIINGKHFTSSKLSMMWAHFRYVNTSDKESVAHFEETNQFYLQNPCDKMYQVFEPLFRLICDNDNLQIVFIPNVPQEHGITICKVKGEYFMRTLSIDHHKRFKIPHGSLMLNIMK